MHIRDVYITQSNNQWVKEGPPETRSRQIKEFKPEELENLKCFIWKNFSLDAPRLNAPPADKIKIIEEELNPGNSGNPKVVIFVPPTNTKIVRYI